MAKLLRQSLPFLCPNRRWQSTFHDIGRSETSLDEAGHLCWDLLAGREIAEFDDPRTSIICSGFSIWSLDLRDGWGLSQPEQGAAIHLVLHQSRLATPPLSSLKNDDYPVGQPLSSIPGDDMNDEEAASPAAMRRVTGARSDDTQSEIGRRSSSQCTGTRKVYFVEGIVFCWSWMRKS